MHALTEQDFAIVYAIVKRHYWRIWDKEDLISDGMVGLVEAANKYDVSSGVPFNAYAGQRVHGAIRDGLRRMDWARRAGREVGFAERLETRVMFRHAMSRRCEEPFEYPAFWAMAAEELLPLELAVVRARFCEGLSLKETAHALGYRTKYGWNHVSQIHARAIARLRAMVQ